MEQVSHQPIYWRCERTIEKFWGDPTQKERDSGLIVPYYVDTQVGNLLVIGGASALWQRLIGTAVTAFDNTNARIGVGISATAAADTQTDLQAAAGGANRENATMDATYPLHTDSTGTAGSKTITYRGTFGTGVANFAWNEWGVFNGVPGTGRMLNRKQEALGTKTSAATWVLTITLSLA
jgi:hypothetical protein